MCFAHRHDGGGDASYVPAPRRILLRRVMILLHTILPYLVGAHGAGDDGAGAEIDPDPGSPGQEADQEALWADFPVWGWVWDDPPAASGGAWDEQEVG